MKTVFIINPKAGQGKNIDRLIDNIKVTSEKLGTETKIYITKSVGDAEKFVKEYIRRNGAARFIACGGDGTLNEVINGAVDYEGAEVGVIPIGTGNDFCRNFGALDGFGDITAQICGESVKCDLIRYSNDTKTGYCVNMFNIGFDCNVADMATDLKKKPFVSGSFAYFLSIFINLIKKNGANLEVALDGKAVHNGQLLLTSVANGSYCGGGIKSNPLASIQDGFININIVNNVSRLKFIRLLFYYMKGTFLELPHIENVVASVKCRRVTVNPFEGKMKLCIDGEITIAGKTEFEIVHKAFNFVVPTIKLSEAVCSSEI